MTERMCFLFLGTVLFYLAASLLLSLLGTVVPIHFYIYMAAGEIFIFLPAWYYLHRRKLPLKQALRTKKSLNFATFLLLIPTALFLEVTVSFISYITALPFGNAVSDTMAGISGYPVIVNILLIAVLPALAEEAVFRGVLYRGLRKHGFWKAALVSSLFFGLIHMNINQFSYAFVLGIVLCLLGEATGSFWAPVMVHFCINLTSVLAMRDLASQVDYEEILSTETVLPSDQALFYGVILFVAAALCTALVALNVWLIAQSNDRLEYLAWTFRGGEKKYLRRLPREKLNCGALWAAVIIPSALLLVMQFAV